MNRSAAKQVVWKYLIVAVVSASVSVFAFANTQSQKLSPGAEPFVPSRIDWLTTTLQASLRDDQMQTTGFQLLITSSDHETVLIFVRYLPDVNRQVMNTSIDATRQVIELTAKGYGWDKWVKIREDVQLAKLDKKN